MSDDHDLLGAYAIGALNPDDAAHFLRHLATCASCEADLWQASIAAGALAAIDPNTARPGTERTKVPKKSDPNHPL